MNTLVPYTLKPEFNAIINQEETSGSLISSTKRLWIVDNSMNRVCIQEDYLTSPRILCEDVLIILRGLNVAMLTIMPSDFVDFYCAVFNFSKPVETLSTTDSRAYLPPIHTVDAFMELEAFKNPEVKEMPLSLIKYSGDFGMTAFSLKDCEVSCYHGLFDFNFKRFFDYANVKLDVVWKHSVGAKCSAEYFTAKVLPIFMKMENFNLFDAVAVTPANHPLETGSKYILMKKVGKCQVNGNPCDIFITTHGKNVIPGQSGSPIFCSKTGNVIGLLGNIVRAATSTFVCVPKVFNTFGTSVSEDSPTKVEVPDSSIFEVITLELLKKCGLMVKGETGIGKTVHIPARVFKLLNIPVVVLVPHIVNTRVDFVKKIYPHLNIAFMSSEDSSDNVAFGKFDIIYCTQYYFFSRKEFQSQKVYCIVDEADRHTQHVGLLRALLAESGNPHMLLSATLSDADVRIGKPSPFEVISSAQTFNSVEEALATLSPMFLERTLVLLDNKAACEHYAKKYKGSYCISGHLEFSKSPIFATSCIEAGTTIPDLKNVINIDFRTRIVYKEGYSKSEALRVPTPQDIMTQTKGRTGRTCNGTFINVTCLDISTRTAPPRQDFLYDLLHPKGDKSERNLGVFLKFKTLVHMVLNLGFCPHEIARRFSESNLTLTVSKAEHDFLVATKCQEHLKSENIVLSIDKKDNSKINAFQESLSRSKLSFNKSKLRSMAMEILFMYCEDAASTFLWNAAVNPLAWSMIRDVAYRGQWNGLRHIVTTSFEPLPFSFVKHLMKYFLGSFGSVLSKLVKWQHHSRLVTRCIELLAEFIGVLVWIYVYKQDASTLTPATNPIHEFIVASAGAYKIGAVSSAVSMGVGRVSLKSIVDKTVEIVASSKDSVSSWFSSKVVDNCVVAKNKVGEVAQTVYTAEIGEVASGLLKTSSSVFEELGALKERLVSLSKSTSGYLFPTPPSSGFKDKRELLVFLKTAGCYSEQLSMRLGKTTFGPIVGPDSKKELPTNSVLGVAENIVSSLLHLDMLTDVKAPRTTLIAICTLLKVRLLDKGVELAEKLQKVRKGDSFTDKQIESLKFTMNMLPQVVTFLEQYTGLSQTNGVYPVAMDTCVPFLREIKEDNLATIYRSLNQSFSLFRGSPLLYTADYFIMTILKFLDIVPNYNTSFCSVEIVDNYLTKRNPFDVSFLIHCSRFILSFLAPWNSLFKPEILTKLSTPLLFIKEKLKFFIDLLKKKSNIFGEVKSFSDPGNVQYVMGLLTAALTVWCVVKIVRGFISLIKEKVVTEVSMPSEEFYGTFSNKEIVEKAKEFTLVDPFDLFGIERLPPDTEYSKKYLSTSLCIEQGPNWKVTDHHFPGYVKARHPIIYDLYLNNGSSQMSALKYDIQEKYDVDSMRFSNTTAKGFYAGKHKRKNLETILPHLPQKDFLACKEIVFEKMEVDHTPLPPCGEWVEIIKERTNMFRGAKIVPFGFMKKNYPELNIQTNGEYLDHEDEAKSCFDEFMKLVNERVATSVYYEFPKIEKLAYKLYDMPVLVNGVYVMETIIGPCRVITTSFQEHKCADAVSTVELSASMKKLPSFFVGRTPAEYADELTECLKKYRFATSFDLKCYDSCISPVHVSRETEILLDYVSDPLKKEVLLWSCQARLHRVDFCYDGTSYYMNTGRASGDQFYTTYGNTIHSSILGTDILLKNGFKKEDFGVTCCNLHQGDDSVIFNDVRMLEDNAVLEVITSHGFICKEISTVEHSDKNPISFLSHYPISKVFCGKTVNLMNRPLDKIMQKFLICPEKRKDYSNPKKDFYNVKYLFSCCLSFGILYFHQPEFFSLMRIVLCTLPAEVCSFIPYEKSMHFRLGIIYDKLVAEKTTMAKLTPGFFLRIHRDGEDFPDFDDSYNVFTTFTPPIKGLLDHVQKARASVAKKFRENGWEGKLTFYDLHSYAGWKKGHYVTL